MIHSVDTQKVGLHLFVWVALSHQGCQGLGSTGETLETVVNLDLEAHNNQ